MQLLLCLKLELSRSAWMGKKGTPMFALESGEGAIVFFLVLDFILDSLDMDSPVYRVLGRKEKKRVFP